MISRPYNNVAGLKQEINAKVFVTPVIGPVWFILFRLCSSFLGKTSFKLKRKHLR